MAASVQERTEKPTAKKLQKARSEGQLAKSREIISLASLLGGAIGLWIGLAIIYNTTKAMLENLWGNGFAILRAEGLSFAVFSEAVQDFLIMASPAMLLSLIFAVGSNLYQNKGMLFVWSKVFKFDLDQLNPVNGLKRLLSLRSLVELFKSSIKFGAVSYALYSTFLTESHLFLPTVMEEPSDIVKTMGHTTFVMFLRVLVIMTILSYLDLRYQKWQHIKDLMMTKQEVKEEHKQAEGDPRIKSKIRSKQLELARKRMLSQVPKAEVVITNPTHYAVALAYKPKEMDAPKVVAKGIDYMAQKIIKIARHHGVPVHHNPPLARALYRYVPLEGFIPVTLYKAVAKVLAYIYQQRRSRYAREGV